MHIHHKVRLKLINSALEIGTTQTPEAVLFWFLAPISVLASLGMLLVKKAVHSALLHALPIYSDVSWRGIK